MAKKKPNGPVEGSPFANMSVGAVVDAVQIAEAVQAVGRLTMDPPQEDPKGVVVPSPFMAQQVLEELGILNDKAAAALEDYEDLKEQLKAARLRYDKLAETLISKLKAATHASPLPLFDPVQREADQARMEEAASASPQAEPAPVVGLVRVSPVEIGDSAF